VYGAESDATRVEFRIRNDDGIKVGLNSRPNNTECVAGDRPTASINGLSLSMKNAFPGITFDQPVAMVQAPGDDARYFVVEIAGTIKVIDNGILQDAPFLDISNNIGSRHEDGLYSIAFHPDYQTNGYFYISYVDANAFTQVDRFQVSDNPNRAIASSEFTPGNANRSLVFNRPGRLDEGQMPPIGTNMLDTQGLALMEDWINSLNGCPLKLTTEVANGSISPANGGFDPGLSVQFSAIPDPGYEFSGWSGDLSGLENPVSLIFDSNKTVRANFTEITDIQPEPRKGGGSFSLSGLFGLLLLLIQRQYLMTLKASKRV